VYTSDNFKTKFEHLKMYKRPTPRRTGCYVARPAGVFDAGSRVGEVLTKMQETRVTRPRPAAWRPSWDYLFIAQHLPETEREAYIAKCEAWLEANAYTPPVPAAPPVIDVAPVIDLMERHGVKRPPIDECETAWRDAGYSEAKIAKGLAYMRWIEATVDERQEALDAIFSKWNLTAKTATKPKKVIKAVKKRL
jgi:hypothetical protein